MAESVLERPNWWTAIALGLSSGVAVICFFSLPACLFLSFLGTVVGSLLSLAFEDDPAFGASILGIFTGFVSWWVGAKGALFVGVPVSILFSRARVAAWWAYLIAGIAGGFLLVYLEFIPSGTYIGGPSLILNLVFALHGGVYGLLFWFAPRWISSAVLREGEWV